MLRIRSIFKRKSALDALLPQNGIQNYFVIQKFTFKRLGIDITSERNTVFNPFLTWMLLVLIMGLGCLMLILAMEFKDDLDLVTDVLIPFWQSLLVAIKMCCFLRNQKKIVKLVRHVWLWNLKAKGEEFDIILEENRKERFFSLLFYRYVLATAITALFSPFLVAMFSYFKGQGFMNRLELPFKAAYHTVLNPKSYTGYLLADIWNFFALYLLVNGSVANDTLFSWFAYNVSAQFRILSLRFKSTADILRTADDENHLIKSLIRDIEYHQSVIELANYFNEVFMMTVLCKYTVSLLQIAFLIYQIARGGELSIMMFHILFLMSVGLQLMMYCRGGQRVSDESTSIALTIYENFKWHKMSKKSKKLLLLVMMRAKRPCISTGVFFVVDLPLFVWVFKTSGSFFTMLKSMEA